AARVRLLRVHGQEPGYVHTVAAGNARMSEIEAAALRVGLHHLVAQNERRRTIAARYRDAAPALAWQSPHPRHVYHLCVARGPDRDTFRDCLPFETAGPSRRAL